MTRLEEMTLEELWELFPIILTPHNDSWKDWAMGEMRILAELLNPFQPTLSHIGSTAIPSIMAKPIVDLLVEVPADADYRQIRLTMERAGYICMSAGETRLGFNKGYTVKGYADRVFHIHIHRYGDNDEIKFRDCLLKNPDTAKEYEKLKLSLLPKYTNNRDGYTQAKTSFILSVLAKA